MKISKVFAFFIAATVCISCSNNKTSNEATQDNVKNNEPAVEQVSKPVAKILDFNATWCGPCKQMAPVIDKAEKEYSGKVVFEKIDVDQNGELANKYGIQSIPTLVYLDAEGNEITRTVGGLSETELRNQINSLLN